MRSQGHLTVVPYPVVELTGAVANNADVFPGSIKKKAAAIIDCFEVFIDCPSAVKTRAQKWSSYQHPNT